MDVPRKARKSPFKPFLLGAVLGAGATAAAMYFMRPAAPPPTRPAQATAPAPCPQPTQAEATQPKQAKDFAFYGVLEKAPVTPTRPDLEQPPMPPAVAALPPSTPTPSAEPAKVTPFYLQLAAFKTEEDADALKARIALTGVAVSVSAMEIPDKGTFYRVRVGPFTSQEEAARARAQLAQAGIPAGNAFPVR